MADILLALDQGSSSSRALALDSKGRVVAKAQQPVRTFYPKPGWVEHDAEDLRRSQERALDLVLSKLPKSSRVLGLGLSCQRSTLVLWDSNTGRPLSRVPSWQDGRAAPLLERFYPRQQEIHGKTGLYANPYYSSLKLRWLLENDSRVRKAADSGTLRAGPVASYLLWHWTKGGVFAADPSLAQRMLLFNIRTLDWDFDLLASFGISREWLPAISPSACSWGEFARKGRTIPVLAVLGDQQAAALSLGADQQGAAVANYGTGAFFLLNTGAEDRRVPGLLTSVAWQQPGQPCHYFLEGTVHAAGTAFQWLKENFGILKDVTKADALCRRSKRRVLALMAIGGLGAPRWDYSTFTAFAGLDAKTRSEDLVRAVAEGIAFLVADIVFAIRHGGLSVESVRAAGGLSRMDYLLQFQSDILQLPISRARESEATALGAAALAAAQAGLDVSRLASARTVREFKPRMPRGEAEKLASGWKLFVETQQRLSSELKSKLS